MSIEFGIIAKNQADKLFMCCSARRSNSQSSLKEETSSLAHSLVPKSTTSTKDVVSFPIMDVNPQVNRFEERFILDSFLKAFLKMCFFKMNDDDDDRTTDRQQRMGRGSLG